MLGKILGFNKIKNEVEIKFINGLGTIRLITPSVIQIFTGKNETKSKALNNVKIIQCNMDVLDEEENVIVILTSALKIFVYEDFKTDIYNLKGELVCKDYREGRKIIKRKGISAEEMGEGLNLSQMESLHKIEIIKEMLGEEYFYGLGEETGYFNKKWYRYEMWNSDVPMPHVESIRSLYVSVPFFITLRKNISFGIFFDNTFKTYFDMGFENQNYYYFASDNGEFNYYFIYGPEIKNVIEGYTYLTGVFPIPQLWSLGYQQSRWSYGSQETVVDLAKKFRDKMIPCDVIYLDINYMEKYKVFTWDKERFKNFKEMTDKLRSSGFKIVPIIDPGVKKEEEYKVYEEGIKNNYFIKNSDGSNYINKVWPGDALFPDFTMHDAGKWWGDNVKTLLDHGAAGIWNDMNEPATFNGPIEDEVIFQNDGKITDHSEIHNIYGHLMAEATYESIKNNTNKRPFVLTRAGFSGTQRYSAVWTGDNQSFWENLRLSIPMLLNLGISGFPLCGSDVGGFQNDCTSELFCRWIELGCFIPFFRNHSCIYTKDQEPWAFGRRIEEISRKYIELRYKLLPYIYNLFKEAEDKGLPPMRPLVLNYQDDENTYEINDEFLLGNDMLIAPALNQGEKARLVYIPEGKWYDFWNNKIYEGKSYIISDTPLEKCPVFIRSGGIIPTWDVQQYVGEKPMDTVNFEIYPGNNTYKYYEDNGTDYKYRNGEYNIYNICEECSNGNLIIKIENIHYGYLDGAKHFVFHVHGFDLSKVNIENSFANEISIF